MVLHPSDSCNFERHFQYLSVSKRTEITERFGCCLARVEGPFQVSKCKSISQPWSQIATLFFGIGLCYLSASPLVKAASPETGMDLRCALCISPVGSGWSRKQGGSSSRTSNTKPKARKPSVVPCSAILVVCRRYALVYNSV